MALVVVAAVVWAVLSQGRHRLLWLNLAGIFAVLFNAVVVPIWQGGWALMLIPYAPFVALAYCCVATLAFIVTDKVLARRRRVVPDGP